MIPMRFMAWVVAAVLAAAAVPLPAAGQAGAVVDGPAVAAPAPNRPRIGLVLSGGGARGGAHLGVLRVLRELRVPVDVVVGTSAGSIIGAAYASGMTLEEIERELRPLRTDRLFHDVERSELPLRLKADDAVNFIGPEVGVGAGGLALPKAAVAGVSLEGVLRRLTVRQRGPSFDDLPIPFRAVATDLETAEMVVLARGSLATAVRASMALPAIVNPVEIDGRVLVDGGVSRNLPVDVARRMGAEIVIAVNISSPLQRRGELVSVLSVSDQLIRMLTARNVTASLSELGERDVLITPELDAVSSADFDRLLEVADVGERAARAAAARLAPLGIGEAAYAVHEERRHVPPPDARRIDEVRISGTQRARPDVLRAGMDSRPGGEFDAAVAEADMLRLYARGDFERVSYRLEEGAGGARVLAVDVTEKPWGPHYLRLGLGLMSDFRGNASFDLLLMHRRPWLNALGAEWRNTLQFGRTSFVRTEWHQPLVAGQQLFLEGRAEARREPFDLYLGGERLARFRRSETRLGADLGYDLGGKAELRLGVSRGTVALVTDTGIIAGDKLLPRTDVAGAQVRLRVDTLDSLRFPREGLAADAGYYHALPSLGATQAYGKAQLSLLAARSAGPHSVRFGVFAQQGVGGRELPGWELAQLGGFLRLSGYRTGELLGTGARLARMVYTYRIGTPGLLEGVYLGASSEVGRLSGSLDDGVSGTLRGRSMFLAADTPLGPVYLALGAAPGGHRALYLFLGLP